MDNRYGLSAKFFYQTTDGSMSAMRQTHEFLQGIRQSVESLDRSLGSANIGKQFSQMGREAARGTNQADREFRDLSNGATTTTKDLKGLRAEFRALRAESRLIDFGSDLQNDRQFKAAAQQVHRYVDALKALESQSGRTNAAEREFVATLKRQQNAATSQIEINRQQRRASLAAERVGASESMRDAGRVVIDNVADPLESAMELQKNLAGVRKLASDISDTGFKSISKQVFTMASDLAIADTEVTKVLEDLAGSGKKFNDSLNPQVNRTYLAERVSEAEQILKNRAALDVTTDAATALDITLGSIYKNNLSDYQGGIVELNARTASSINELADKLQDVKISAEDVLPTMKIVLNTVGNTKNFPVDQVAAYSAAVSSLGTIDPEAAGSFLNRLGSTMADPKMAQVYSQKLNYGSVSAFDREVNTDKLAIIQKIAEAYTKVQGGELKKGGFLKSLGIDSVQDQKLIQGLASQIDVLAEARKVSRRGFQGVDEQGNLTKELSISAELTRTMQTSAFQTERFKQSVTALKNSLASLALETLTPLISTLGTGLSLTLKISQQFPFLTKVVVLSTIAFAALATTLGTVGVLLFGLQQASATASVAMLSLSKGMLPLTGFFATATQAFVATNPLVTVLNLLRASFLGLMAPISSTTTLVGTLGSVVVGTLLSPLGLTIAALVGLVAILELATPQVSILGTVLGGLAAPLAFLLGFAKGFGREMMSAFRPVANVLTQTFAVPLQAIGDVMRQAQQIFQSFERRGESAGQAVARAILLPFQSAGALVAQIWQSTVASIQSSFAPLIRFAERVGMWLVHLLAENSPGPTFLIRQKWEQTIAFIQEQIAGWVDGLRSIKSIVGQLFSDLASRIQGFFRWNQMVQGVELLNRNLTVMTGTIAALWSQASATFTQLKAEFDATAIQVKSVVDTISREANQFLILDTPVQQFAKFNGVLSAAALNFGHLQSYVATFSQTLVDNLDLFALVAFTLSSMPLGLVKGLAPGSPLLTALKGLPTALAFLLPSGMGIAISTGLLKNLEDALGNKLQALIKEVGGETGANLVNSFTSALSVLNQHVQSILQPLFEYLGGVLYPLIQTGFFLDITRGMFALQEGIPQLIAIFKGLYGVLEPFIAIALQLVRIAGFLISIPLVSIYSFVKPLLTRFFPPLVTLIEQTAQGLKTLASTRLTALLEQFTGVTAFLSRIAAAARWVGETFMIAMRPIIAVLLYARDVLQTFAQAIRPFLPVNALAEIGSALSRILGSLVKAGALTGAFFRLMLKMSNYIGSKGFFDFGVQAITPLDLFLKRLSAVGESIVKVKVKALTLRQGMMMMTEQGAVAGASGLKFLDRIRIFLPAQLQLFGAALGTLNLIYIAFKLLNRETLRGIPIIGEALAVVKTLYEGFYEQVLPGLFQALAIGVKTLAITSIFVIKTLLRLFNLLSSVYNRVSDVMLATSGIIYSLAQPVQASREGLEQFLKTLRGDDFEMPQWAAQTLDFLAKFQVVLRPIAQLAEIIGGVMGTVLGFAKNLAIAIPLVVALFRFVQTKNPLLALKDAFLIFPRMIAGVLKTINFAKAEISQKGIDTLEHQIQKKALNLKFNLMMPQYEREIQQKELTRQREVLGFRKALDAEAQKQLRRAGVWGTDKGRYSASQMDEARGVLMQDDRSLRSIAMASGVDSFKEMASKNQLDRLRLLSDDKRTQQYIETGMLTSRDLYVDQAHIKQAQIGGQAIAAAGVVKDSDLRSQISNDPRIMNDSLLKVIDEFHSAEGVLRNFRNAMALTEDSLRTTAQASITRDQSQGLAPSYSPLIRIGNQLGMSDADIESLIDPVGRGERNEVANENAIIAAIMDRQGDLRESLTKYQSIVASITQTQSQAADDLNKDRQALVNAVKGGGGPFALLVRPLQQAVRSIRNRFRSQETIQSGQQTLTPEERMKRVARVEQLKSLTPIGRTPELIDQDKASLALLQRYTETPEAQRVNFPIADLREVSKLVGYTAREDMSPDQIVQQIKGQGGKFGQKMSRLRGELEGGIEGLVGREFGGSDAKRQAELINLLRKGDLESLRPDELLKISKSSNISIPQLFDPKAIVTRAQQRAAIPLREEALLQRMQSAGIQDSTHFTKRLRDVIPGGQRKTDQQMDAIYKLLKRGQFDQINEEVLAGVARLLKVQSTFGDTDKGLSVQMRKQFSAQELIAEDQRNLKPIQRISRRVQSAASMLSPANLPGVNEAQYGVQRFRSLREINQQRQKQAQQQARRQAGLNALLESKAGGLTGLTEQLKLNKSQMQDIVDRLVRGQIKDIAETQRDIISEYLAVTRQELTQLDRFAPKPPTRMEAFQRQLSRYVGIAIDQIKTVTAGLMDVAGTVLNQQMQRLAQSSPVVGRGLQAVERLKANYKNVRQQQRGYEAKRQFSLQQMMKRENIGSTADLWTELRSEGLDLEQVQAFLKGPKKGQSLQESLGGNQRGSTAIEAIARVFDVKPQDMEAFQKSYTAKVVAPFPVYLGEKLAQAAGQQILKTAQEIGKRSLRAARYGTQLSIAIVGPQIARSFGRTALMFSNRAAISLNNSLQQLFPGNQLLRRVEDGLLRRGQRAQAFFERRAVELEASNPLKELFASVRTTVTAIAEGFKTLVQQIRQGVQAAMQRAPGLLSSLFSTMQQLVTGIVGGARSLFAKITERWRRGQSLRQDVEVSKSAIREARQQRATRTAASQETIFGIDQSIQRRQQQMETASPQERQSLAKQIRRAEIGKRLMTERLLGSLFDATDQQQVLKEQRSVAVKKLAEFYREKSPVSSLIDSVMSQATNTFSGLAKKVSAKLATAGSTLMAKGHRQAIKTEPIERLSQGSSPDTVIRRMGSVQSPTIRLLSEAKIAAGRAAQDMAIALRLAAERASGAWEQSDRSIRVGVFGRLVKRAFWAGRKILGYISEASPGPSYQIRQNYDMTADSVEASMNEMAMAAKVAGHTIDREMSEAAHHSGREVGKLRGVFGKVMNAGMMIGGAIVGIGFASQQVVGSLTSLGLIDEKTAESFNKLFEVFSLIGGVGAMLAPIASMLMGMVGMVGQMVPMFAGLVPTIATIGGTIFTFLISPIGLTIAAVVAGALLINEVIKRVFGVDALGSLMSSVGGLLVMPFSWAAQQIQALWGNLMGGWFGKLFGPLLKIVTDVGQQLISKLSENSPGPTWQIRENWLDMVGAIVKSVFGLVGKIARAGLEIVKVLAEAYHQLEQSVFGKIIQLITGLVQFALKMAWQLAFGFAPVLTVLGLLGLALFGLKKDFLGLETILTHFFDTIKGGALVVSGAIKTTVAVAKGFVAVLKGIPQAARGNFAPMREGLGEALKVFRLGTEQIGGGIKTLLGSQIHFIQGSVRAIKQLVGIILVVIQVIGRTRLVLSQAAEGVGFVFSQAGKGIARSKSAILLTLSSIFLKFHEIRSVALVLSDGVQSIELALKAAAEGFRYFTTQGEAMGQELGVAIGRLIRQIAERISEIPDYVRKMLFRAGQEKEATTTGREIGNQILIGMGSALGYLGGLVKGVALGILSELKTTAIGPAIVAVEQGVASMMNAWNSLRSGVSGIMANLETLVGGSTEAIRGMMKRMLTLDAIRESFALFAVSGEEAGRRVAQALIRGIRLVSGFLGRLAETLKAPFSQIPDYFRRQFSQVKQEAPQAGNAIGLKILLGLTTALGFIASFFGGIFSELLASLRTNLLTPMGQAISSAFGGLQGVAAEQLAPIAKIFSGVADRVLDVWQNLRIGVESALAATTGSVANWVADVKQRSEGLLTGLLAPWKLLQSSVKSALEAVEQTLMVYRTAARSLLDDLVEGVMAPWRAISAIVASALETVDRTLMVYRTAARSLLDDLVEGVMAPWRAISAIVTSTLETIDRTLMVYRTAARSLLDDLVEGVMAPWRSLPQQIDTILTTLKERVNQKAADIKEVLIAFVDPYVQAWKTAQSFTENTLINISNAVIALPERLKTAFADLISALTGMWTGFVERIEATFAGVKQKVVDTVNRFNPLGQKDRQADTTNAVAPPRSILKFWQKTNDSVTAEIKDLEGTAKEEGKKISKDLSEGSPGPSYWVRQNWAHTGAFVGGVIQDLRQESLVSGQQIQRNLEVVNDAAKRTQNSLTHLSPAGQQAVGMVLKTFETEELPSRQEILKTIKMAFGEFFKNAGKAVKEGNQRERMVRAMLEAKTGKAIPSRMALMGSGIKAGAGVLRRNAPTLPERLKDGAVKGYRFVQEQGLANEALVGGSGALTGMMVESKFGTAAGIAADVTASLTMRKALKDITAVSEARKKLKEDATYQQTGTFRKLQMLRAAAVEELHNPHVKAESKDRLIEDVGGWAIGNTVDQTAKAAGLGVPLIGMGAAMHAVPKVVEGVHRYQAGENAGTVVKDVAQQIAPVQVLEMAAKGHQREQEARAAFTQSIRNYKAMAGDLKDVGLTLVHGSDQTSDAWLGASQEIVGYWQKLGNESDETRNEIVNNLNHGASDTTSTAWRNATREITGNFDVLANHAAITGGKIAQSMQPQSAIVPYRPNSSALTLSDRPGNLEMPPRSDSSTVRIVLTGLDTLVFASHTLAELQSGAAQLSSQMQMTMNQTSAAATQQWQVVSRSVQTSLQEVSAEAKATRRQVWIDLQPLLQVIGKHWNILTRHLQRQMMNVVGSAVTTGQQIVLNLWTRIQNLPQHYQTLSQQLQSSFSRLGSWLQTRWSQFTQTLRSGVASLTTQIQSNWHQLTESVQGFLSRILARSKTTNPLLERLLGSALVRQLIRGWQFFTTSVQTGFTKVTAGWTVFRGQTQQLLSRLIQQAKGTGRQLFNFLGDRVLNPVGAAWHQLSRSVGVALTSMAQQTRRVGQRILADFGTAIANRLPPAVKVAFQEISAQARITGRQVLADLQPLGRVIEQNWQKNRAIAKSALAAIAAPAQQAGNQVVQALGPKISARLPQRLTATLQQSVQRLATTANIAGSSVASDLGTRVKNQITQAWEGIAGSVTASMQQINERGQAANQKLRDQLSRVAKGAQEGVGAASQSLNALGSILGDLNPALSSGLFFFGNFLDSGLQLAQSIPQLLAYFGTLITGSTAAGASAVVADAQIATGAAVAAGATAAKGGIIGGINAFLAGSFAALGSAASAAWVALTGPALPFIAIAVAVVAAIVLVYQAVKNNWVGMNDVFNGLWVAMKDLGGAIWSVFTPLAPVLKAIGLVLGGAVLGVVWVLISALKLVVQTVALIIKSVVFLGSLLINMLLLPFRAIWLLVQGIGTVFAGLGQAIGAVLMVPINGLGSMLQGFIQMLSSIPSAVGSVFSALWNMIPTPLRWLIEQAASGATWVIGALTGGNQTSTAPVRKYAAGGLVTGPGTGTSDQIPALVSNREFIMPAAPTQRNLPMLEAMRQGDVDLTNLSTLTPTFPTVSPVTTVPQVKSLPRLPVPVPPPAAPIAAPAATDASPIQFNLSFGDIHLHGGATQESAEELLEIVEMKIKARLPGWLRDLVELRRG